MPLLARALAFPLALNLHYLIRKALRRPTCILERGARLGSKAKILNARGKSDYIRIGRDSVVLGELFVFAHGGQIEIGKRCYIDAGTRIWSGASIKIEDDVIVGPDVNVFDNRTHPLDAHERHEQIKSIFTIGHPKRIDLGDRPVRICQGALIGARAMILRGVTIGSGSIVLPGAIITKNI